MEELVYDENGIIISHNGPDISGFAGLTQTQINNKIADHVGGTTFYFDIIKDYSKLKYDRSS